MASDKLINDMMGSGLSILSKVTNSSIVERLGLEEQA